MLSLACQSKITVLYKTVNIILKAFDGPYCKIIMERAFRDVNIGTCISTMWPGSESEHPDVGAEEHIFMDAEKLKLAIFPDADWNAMEPVDEQLVEQMRECEAVFMTMITRMEEVVGREIPYAERKKQYLQHLRYWNHILETKNIDFFLLNHAPHQIYDLVLYDLCKLKGIRTLFVDRCFCIDAFFLVEHWADPGKEMVPILEELKKEYANPDKEIPLSPKYEVFYKANAMSSEEPWYAETRSKHLLKKSFISRWSSAALGMIRKKPLKFLTRVLSPTFWQRKLREHSTIRFYDEHISDVNLEERFIYVPLHMQPEATTCPLAGAFVDQELMVQLLAKYLPDDIKIYIKEHPSQGETMRSKEFYQSLIDIPSVRFVPRSSDTLALTEKSVAVATGTGTAAFEGIFREIPSLMFGHRFFQYADGIYMVHTAKDLQAALHKILDEGKKPTLRNARLFLKAMEACTTPYPGGVRLPDEKETKEEKAELMGEKIAQRL